MSLDELRQQEYNLRLEVTRLRREMYEQPNPNALDALLGELEAAERELNATSQKRAKAQADDPNFNGLIIDTNKPTSLLGRDTTGLEATVHLRMEMVPTSICHLLNPTEHPLISCRVKNFNNKTIRLRLTSFIEQYSARAVDTFELETRDKHEFHQLPTFFPARLRTITELTRATLNVMLEDLDGQVELHVTKPIWLLSRNAAPLAVQDPKTGQWQQMTPYFGAFVTPNAPSVVKLLRLAAGYHPQKRLRGTKAPIEPQVKAIFEMLKNETEMTYVNSLIAFSPDEGFSTQRVRLPRESLQEKQANCLDGTVLFASLLEAISLSPAIVTIPQHAFVGWQSGADNEWKYLDPTMIGSHSFEEASKWAAILAKRYEAQAKEHNDQSYFQRYPLSELRAIHRITPME